MCRLAVFSAFSISALADPLSRREEQHVGGRIVGGQDVLITDVPYQVSIVGEGICGGSIISKNLVLTAAHCFEDEIPRSMVVWAGSRFLNKGSMHQISEVYIHEKFTYARGAMHYDIAIAKVSIPFEFDETRQPIRLFNSTNETKDGSLGIVSGWGTQSFGGDLSPTLKIVALPIISKEKCSRAFRYGIPDGQICAAAWGKDACQGDSGGPLAINGSLAGIVLWGEGCADGFPGVYTEVAFYQSWIQMAVNLLK